MGYFAAVLWYGQQNLGNTEEERYRKVRQNSRVLKNRDMAIVRKWCDKLGEKTERK